jgi:flagellar secretion chaperone FliS
VSTDAGRLRYLANAVSTATPAQRIVMLYDRLGLDIERAASVEVSSEASPHVRHAQQIVAELLSSLDSSVWAGADDLAAIYGYLLTELIGCNTEPAPERLRSVGAIVADLRSSWHEAGQQIASAPARPASLSAFGAWVG